MKEIWENELSRLRRENLFREFAEFTSSQGPWVVMEGRSMLLLASNSYLNLTTHPEVIEAACTATRCYGAGSGGSRLISGTVSLHIQLEEKIAHWKRAEQALLFNTGYMANLGVITGLVGPGDLILSDELNHASIIDGCRLSRATVSIYRHGDINHLADLLREERKKHRRCLIVTDGVFSMDGDLAPLPEIVRLAKAYEAWTLVDDAHGTGVLGTRGSGTVEYFGLEGWVTVQMGTLSKALASQGAYVTGESSLMTCLRHRARSFIFSTALPPASVAAALAAVDIVEREPERRQRLAERAEFLRRGLQGLGYHVPEDVTPILPVMIGDSRRALDLAAALREEGIFLTAIRPPTVAPGSSRLRVTVMADHSLEDLKYAIDAFRRAGLRIGLIKG